MANYNRSRKSYGGRNNSRQQKPTSFACPRKFYSLCSHRLGEGVGLVGIFDKLNPEDNIKQGNIELLCLEKLHDLIVDIPDNAEEILNTKVRVFVPDMLSYLINGDVADFIHNGVRINGDEIDQDLLELIDDIDTMLREKSRNVNIRLYKYQPNELKSESQDWFQGLVDSYLNGLASSNTKPVVQEIVFDDTALKKYSKMLVDIEDELIMAEGEEEVKLRARKAKIQDAVNTQLDMQARALGKTESETEAQA